VPFLCGDPSKSEFDKKTENENETIEGEKDQLTLDVLDRQGKHA